MMMERMLKISSMVVIKFKRVRFDGNNHCTDHGSADGDGNL